ncbi:MAG: hypothetical protein NTV72_03015 [Candidatus Taylorbacteria bacterium]|nr:hypothetical protein [Candidatus Taylorbacteria bacterium]
MEPSTSGMKPWQLGVTVLVIVIVLGIIGYFIFKSPSTPSGETPSTNVAVNQPANGQNRILVSDQYPGDKVYITTVQIAKPGFVVINKNNDGAPGAVIGSKWFDAGTTAGQVTLSEKTVNGGTYYAVLHDDVVGDQKYDDAKDSALRDDAGKIIMQSFKVSDTITESKG